MDDRLKALLHLQEVDDEIARAEEQLRSLPIRVQAAERELTRHREALSALHDDLIDIQKEADERELQLKSGEAQISKLQTQRLAVKTNREYQAVTTSIGGNQASVARLEDQILALYAKVEQAQKAHDEQAAEVRRAIEYRDAVLAENREEEARLKERLVCLERQSREARHQIGAEPLRLYDQQRGRLGGPPLAAVRDEVCAGCNMAVSPQTISLLQLGRDLIQCTSCTRILFLDGDVS